MLRYIAFPLTFDRQLTNRLANVPKKTKNISKAKNLANESRGDSELSQNNKIYAEYSSTQKPEKNSEFSSELA